MSTTKNGGPAFPMVSGALCATGMTLRDYFAAAALSGLLANQKLARGYLGGADDAYEFADAMLKRRTKIKEAQS